MNTEEIEIESIGCVKTRCLRVESCTTEGDALPIYNEERERRISAHQKRIQEELCIR